MICDICSGAIPERPACLLGTKDVVTSKDCWKLYLKNLIANNFLSLEAIQSSLSGLVGQMACSDTPWALCDTCTASLINAGFSFRPDKEELSPRGHALCRSTKFMEFEVLDEQGMARALRAANAAANEIEKESISAGGVRFSSRSEMKNTKWQHGPTRFEMVDLDMLVGPRDGLIPVPVALDPEIGDEVVLFLRDQTPFMQQLKRVKPFQLFLKVGVGRNRFGPVPFLLFYVPNPVDDSQPFVAYDLYLNPSSKNQIAQWRKLADQSHWHLFLVGAGNQQEDFFEFGNNFQLNESLDSIQAACENIQMVDFDRAKAEFGDKYSIKDLYRM